MPIIFSSVGNGVELMVAHYDLGGSGFLHVPNYGENRWLLFSSVNQVTYEDRLTVGVAVGATGLRIAQAFEQSFQFLTLSVHITDDVEAIHAFIVPRA